MGKIDNELKMLHLIESGKIYKTKELANILEVSERQIRTYKQDLEKSGYSINSYNGRNGGYFCNNTKKNIIFSITELNNLENLYLLLEDGEKKTILLDTIEKLRYILLYSTNTRKNRISEIDNKLLNVILQAINEKKVITLITCKDKTKDLEKLFLPHSVFRNNDCYYVTGISVECNEFRTYPFYEIKDIK